VQPAGALRAPRAGRRRTYAGRPCHLLVWSRRCTCFLASTRWKLHMRMLPHACYLGRVVTRQPLPGSMRPAPARGATDYDTVHACGACCRAVHGSGKVQCKKCNSGGELLGLTLTMTQCSGDWWRGPRCRPEKTVGFAINVDARHLCITARCASGLLFVGKSRLVGIRRSPSQGNATAQTPVLLVPDVALDQKPFRLVLLAALYYC
jgi:hypothetical protein